MVVGVASPPSRSASEDTILRSPSDARGRSAFAASRLRRDQTGTSWNLLIGWLRKLGELRQAKRTAPSDRGRN